MCSIYFTESQCAELLLLEAAGLGLGLVLAEHSFGLWQLLAW